MRSKPCPFCGERLIIVGETLRFPTCRPATLEDAAPPSVETLEALYYDDDDDGLGAARGIMNACVIMFILVNVGVLVYACFGE